MSELLQLEWTWYPSVVIGFTLWTLAYLAALGPLRPRQAQGPGWQRQIAFHAGTLIALLALVSPLDELGDEHLFSAHMLQHLLLMFATAPLWLVGLPGWLVERIFPGALRRAVTLFTHPVASFTVFAGVMVFWHIPAIYQIAQTNEGIHIFEHLTFIGGALIGWWPVAGPSSPSFPRTAAPVRVLYTFLLAFPCTALAAILTFATAPLYPFHAQGGQLFGLTPLEDQRLGGLMMWFPTHMVILFALGVTFFRWLGSENRQAAGELVSGSSHKEY
jgi:putative membrane protein